MSTRNMGLGAVLIGALILISLLVFTHVPTPITQSSQSNGASVTFQIDNDKVLLPGGCRMVSWRSEGIQKIFFNDQATIGEESISVCEIGFTPPKLTVQFQDDSVTDYTLTVHVLIERRWFQVSATMGVVLLLLGGGLVVSSELSTMGGNTTLRIIRGFEVMLLWGLIAGVMLEGGFRAWVWLTGSEEERLIYLGSADDLTAAANRYINLPFLLYGLNPVRDDVNEMGFRNPPFPLDKPIDEIRIVALGGSTTFGHGLQSNEAWPTLLEQELSAAYPDLNIRVINGGVPGYTTWHSLANLQFRVLELDPDIVMIYHATNDRWQTLPIPPDCYRGNNMNLGLTFTTDFSQAYLDDLPSSAFLRLVALRTGQMEDPLRRAVQPTTTGSTFAQRCPSSKPNTTNENFIHDPVYFQRNVTNMVYIAQQNGIMPILSTWVWRWTDPSNRPEGGFFDYTDTLNETTRTVATQTDTVLIDLAQGLSINPAYFQGDATHMTAEGTNAQSNFYAEYFIENEILGTLLEP